MTHQEIIDKLIGEIWPCGRSEVDRDRLENLKAYCELTELLLNRIHIVSHNSKSHEHSVKEIGEYAKKFLTGINLELKENGYGL